eukprot:gene7735-1384_t
MRALLFVAATAAAGQDPVFEYASSALADNMPVGGGELVANVWANSSDGSVGLLLARSDSVSGYHQPMKLMRLRLALDPSPFKA